MGDYSRVERTGNLNSPDSNKSCCESFLDMTTLTKVGLVVLALLSIAAAITLGGWGETLLPLSFTVKHQIIAGCLLGIFGLALGLGVLIWQTCGSTSIESSEPASVEWSVEFGNMGEDTLLHRRKFINSKGQEIELFVYGEGAQELINGLRDNYFEGKAKTLVLQELFIKNHTKVTMLLCQVWNEKKGVYNICSTGLIPMTSDGSDLKFKTAKAASCNFTLNPSAKIIIRHNEGGLVTLTPSPAPPVKLKKADPNPSMEELILQPEVPLPSMEELILQPEVPFTQWEPTLSEAGDPGKFFREEVKTPDGTLVTLVYYGDNAIGKGDQIANHIREEPNWNMTLSRCINITDSPTFFCTYQKGTATILLGYGLLKKEDALSVNAKERTPIVQAFSEKHEVIIVNNAEQQPLITLTRIAKK